MNELIYIQEDGVKREATPQEVEQLEKDRTEMLETQRLVEIEKNVKAVQKIAILERIGLTEEELQIFLNN